MSGSHSQRPCWFLMKKTALDFMHCIFLGIICHLFMKILFAAYMFPGTGGNQSPKCCFEDLINSVQWPSHITRLPKNLGENQTLKKANEWRCILTIMPVLLWWSWRDVRDLVPNEDPPLPPNMQPPNSSQNCCAIYDTVLLLCVGVWILASCKISMAQVQVGQMFLSQYCLHCLQLGVHLTINHHASMHISAMRKQFGPVYSWWLFAFEHFNALEHVIKAQASDCGAMMTQIAVYQSEAAQDNVRLPL
ncbi:hypothetical protein BS17DRAFT_765413 [Gyrodon lividus]|nr:hypothetical protein BS17DRAFT_765413 [Gyrodon lividus]